MCAYACAGGRCTGLGGAHGSAITRPLPILTLTPPPRTRQYYPYVNNDTIDARGLLDQGLQDFGIGKFNWLSGVAKAVQLPMRISETNSL